MIRMTALLAFSAGGLAGTQAASASPPPGHPHVVEVRMVDNGGGQWRFEPAKVHAEPGDTVRFIQTDIAPHNVQFKDTPAGANLGAAVMGPFLMKKGESYALIIDSRFVPGTYHFVCTPHEMMGMKGTLDIGTGEGVGDVTNTADRGGNP